MRILFVSFVALALCGCGHLLQGEYSVKCKGKGVISAAGGPMYSGAIQADCGDGFEYERRSIADEKQPLLDRLDKK